MSASMDLRDLRDANPDLRVFRIDLSPLAGDAHLLHVELDSGTSFKAREAKRSLAALAAGVQGIDGLHVGEASFSPEEQAFTVRYHGPADGLRSRVIWVINRLIVWYEGHITFVS